MAGASKKRKKYLMFFGIDLKHADTVFCQFIQINIFKFNRFLCHIQLGQTYRIIDQCQQTLRIAVNLFGKPSYIIICRHPVFNQFRITGDGRQRRF